jgi:hypothetical protein
MRMLENRVMKKMSRLKREGKKRICIVNIHMIRARKMRGDG